MSPAPVKTSSVSPSAHLAADAWVAVALAQSVLPLVLHEAGVGHGEGAAIVGCNVWAAGVLLRDSMARYECVCYDYYGHESAPILTPWRRVLSRHLLRQQSIPL